MPEYRKNSQITNVSCKVVSDLKKPKQNSGTEQPLLMTLIITCDEFDTFLQIYTFIINLKSTLFLSPKIKMIKKVIFSLWIWVVTKTYWSRIPLLSSNFPNYFPDFIYLSLISIGLQTPFKPLSSPLPPQGRPTEDFWIAFLPLFLISLWPSPTLITFFCEMYTWMKALQGVALCCPKWIDDSTTVTFTAGKWTWLIQ